LTDASATAPNSEAPVPRRRFGLGDRIFRGTSFGFAAGLVVLLVVMAVVLAGQGGHTFAKFGVHFVTGRSWAPNFDRFGALPLIFGSLVTSAMAIVLAVPVAVGLAVLMNESGGRWLRTGLAVLVDLLAAVPSVVYGLWGIFVMAPVFDHHLEPFLSRTVGKVPLLGALFRGNPNGGDLFTAGVILAVMILPIVTAVTREIIAVVPREQREAAMALGATRYETIRMAVLPYVRNGIFGAAMLGLGRAIGETIAVVMVVGNDPVYVGASLFHGGETIPAVIANEFREASTGGLHRSALLALALVLMAVAFLVAGASRFVVGRAQRTAGGAAPPTPEAVALETGKGMGA
jgi:phosphate transport system permease protein